MRNGRDGVTELVTGRVDPPLSNAERQRRYRERKRAKSGSGVAPDGSWSPAFPGQRAPFQPGNTLGLTSGANSPGRVMVVAAEILSELLGSPDCPVHLRDDGGRVYAHMLELWASAMAQARLLRVWLDSQG